MIPKPFSAASAAFAGLAFLALATALAGCATPAPRTAEEPAPKTRPLHAYASDPFVPVNLYVNANQQVPDEQRELVEYLAAQLENSKAFARVDRGVQRWPITLQLQYATERDASGESLGRRLLSALSLGLVPVHTETVHQLQAEVFLEPDPVGAFRYQARLNDRVTAYAPRDADADRAAIDQLLRRLLGDIASRKLIPRFSSYKPTREKAPERPREQPV